MASIEPFNLAIPEDQLQALRDRLDGTRWVEKETVDDWSQGAPLHQVKALVDHWRHRYDWRRCEAMLNGFGQFRTELDGLNIHFLHIRSPHPNALPLVMTHGWPGSVIEFHKVIGPLTDPVAHGGDAVDAFDLVLPTLPGYGFSGKPAQHGYGVERIAQMWIALMQRLGYDRYVAQGGDWGAAVTTAIALAKPPGCIGIHLNMPIVFPNEQEMADMTPQEAESMASIQAFDVTGSAYAKLQGTKPQTLGYSLADSPVGQAAWIFEKFQSWTDCNGDPRNVLSFDEMLDNIMLYWLPAAGGSSARLYWESIDTAFSWPKVDMPTGCSIFPKEMFRPSRRWVARQFNNIFYWNQPGRGGHFAAFEQPELFVKEIRDCFRVLR